MANNPPDNTPRIVARLAYEDANAAVAFLETAFGFRERSESRIASTDGTILLTELDVVDSRIMVGTVGAHGIASPQTTGAATQGLIVYVDRIDEHFEQASEAGASIIPRPEDQFWGDRRYEAADPEGHLWSFHEHVRDVPQDEVDAALAALNAD